MDVGGYRLHINCTGTGSPTVVIDAGWGDWSTAWGFVQPEVAKTTRVCTYDRAGMGWSDAGPLPRDAAQYAKELHTLLKNANIPGPYVMVGHSLGGFAVRVFVHDYASEIVGVVLIDSMTPQQFTQSPTEVQSPSDSQSQPLSRWSWWVVWESCGCSRSRWELLPDAPPDEQAYYSSGVRPQNVQAIHRRAGYASRGSGGICREDLWRSAIDRSDRQVEHHARLAGVAD